MNTTITVGTFYECNLLDKYSKIVNVYEPTWRHTINGCKILQILQDMYNFNITYVHEDAEWNMTALEAGGELGTKSQVDVYLRPMNFRPEFLDFMNPIHVAYVWRYGFLLRRSDTTSSFRTFYSQPFSRPVWNCLYGMALFVSVFFYFLKRWEKRVLGGYECSFVYEILMVIGAYCQHIPPIDPILPSRRIAYFIFFLFSYIVYTFYTSNLLSNLVNEEDQVYDLEMLGQSDYDFVIPDYINPSMMASFSTYNHNYSMIVKKWDTMKSMTAEECLERLRRGKTAVLSDYASISHLLQKAFEGSEICSLVDVDLFSNIEKYFFTSKNFRYIEKLKIGIMKASETGILKRLIGPKAAVIHCAPSHLVNTRLLQISSPLIVMMCTYILSVVILVAERIHYKRNHVFPYRN